MALDDVTSHFSTMLEPIASASFLSSLSIIHVAIQEPVEVVLGENIKETTTGDGRRKLQTIKDAFYYIPVIPVLERLLNQYDVFVQVGT